MYLVFNQYKVMICQLFLQNNVCFITNIMSIAIEEIPSKFYMFENLNYLSKNTFDSLKVYTTLSYFKNYKTLKQNSLCCLK